VILCGGKVYYDLLEKRRDLKRDDVAIVRIEQLYPFPEEKLIETLSRIANASSAVWCQEEPMNQGAWYSTRHRFQRVGGGMESNVRYSLCRSSIIGRPCLRLTVSSCKATSCISCTCISTRTVIRIKEHGY
jgi:2-oxoglutarate dehydrogenase complex dehydrogenase (E1) component-like enzyme